MSSIIWFKKDLRCRDNQALTIALDNELAPSALFIWPNQAKVFLTYSRPQIAAILRYLPLLEQELTNLGVSLDIIHAKENETEVDTLKSYLNKKKPRFLYFNKKHEMQAEQDEKKIYTFCKARSIEIHTFCDQFIIHPENIKNKTKKPYRIFTPYFKASIEFLNNTDLQPPLPLPRSHFKSLVPKAKHSKKIYTVQSDLFEEYYPISEKEAHNQLSRFTGNQITNYSVNRDFPFLNATSHLSHFLSLGILTGRQCLHKAYTKNNHKLSGGNKGIDVWIAEIFWREFYRYIGYYFPEINQGKPFIKKAAAIPWENHKKVFSSWKNGETGFPFVDAGIRQLNSTGWIHNRLRMIVAMFLTKNLLINWKWGEQYFFENLIDADFFSNNGGWQWSASTGTDSAPYFRIMSPVLQGEKFDPDGKYIKKYIPELKKLKPKEIQEPYKYYESIPNYPPPLVELKTSRANAIKIYKKHL